MMTGRERTTVLIVDDEPLVRDGLVAVLGASPEVDVVGEAEDGAHVPAAVRRLDPDVVLMDVRMPRIDGLEATRQLVRAGARSKVVVLTTFEHDEYVYEALRAGASGFLLKRAAKQEIVYAVCTAAVGDTLLFPDAIRALAADYGQRQEDSNQVARLTEREQEVLRLMAAGLSNGEICERLYLGRETVKTHVRNVFAKLGVRDRTQAVVLAYESGFVLAGGAASGRAVRRQ